MRSFPRIKISPSTLILTTTLILLDRSIISLIPLFAALCHELGHIIVIYFVGAEIDEIEITLFGAEIRQKRGVASSRKSIAIYLAGGGANILSAFVSKAFFPCPATDFFVGCSLALAALNLLPVRSLDGGCALYELLCMAFPTHADEIFAPISAVTLFVLWLAAIFFLLACGGNISMLLFCIYMFLTLYLK